MLYDMRLGNTCYPGFVLAGCAARGGFVTGSSVDIVCGVEVDEGSYEGSY